MLKRLMTTTAILAIATSAYAANPTHPAKDNAAMNSPAVETVATIGSSDVLATKLIGQPVYGGAYDATLAPNAAMQAPAPNTQAQNDTSKKPAPNGQVAQDNTDHNQDRIGDINDLVLAKDGSVDAVIIGVGGFLGMGEKSVAVPYQSLQWSKDANGKLVAHLAITKDELKNAPRSTSRCCSPRPVAASGSRPRTRRSSPTTRWRSTLPHRCPAMIRPACRTAMP